VILSAEKLSAYELCPRRYVWQGNYAALRISPLKALYIALDAGLTTDKDPEKTAENQLLALAANPGLDVTGGDVYAICYHFAKLAGILSVALRSASDEPWKRVDLITLPDGSAWQSACYDDGTAYPRRISLVDSWSDDRKQVEMFGWRTLGESVFLNRPIMLTAISIGSTHDKRRHSAWTRCYRHPRNRTFRLQRKTSDEDFSKTWAKEWREDTTIATAEWLTQMKRDGCMESLVHTELVPVPKRRVDYLDELYRLAGEMDLLEATPAMRLSGCFGFSPCPFISVCHGAKEPKPELYGFRLRA
jgi:hypothetical protein